MLRIKNLDVPLTQANEKLGDIIARRLQISPQNVLEVKILRKAIDARRYHQTPIKICYDIMLKVDGSEKNILAKTKNKKGIAIENVPLKPISPKVKRTSVSQAKNNRPVVVGFGPAGIFAALELARAGLCPLVLERGANVDNRLQAVKRFWHHGILDEKSNVQFGEGGAGTFSDGKLTFRGKSPLRRGILSDFIAAGAPSEIAYLAKPHIGTDILGSVVRNLREEIIRLGGQIRFETQVTDIEFTSSGKVQALILGDSDRLLATTVFLAIGHSARDTYRMLASHNVAMEAKPFAIGVRIEHPQELIDKSQYGLDAGHSALPPADYMLTYYDKTTKRGAYTFCMCPGGQVVSAASALGQLAVNGMSNFARDSQIANSAIVVQVMPEDFGSSALAGVDFQEHWEKAAFLLGGSDFSAPVQTVRDFITKKAVSTDFLVQPSYLPHIKVADLHRCLPAFVSHTLEEALHAWGSKMSAFAELSAPLTGIESRTSAPCRIVRDKETFIATNNSGLYPIGEGAGYAGGIMSSAIDGLRAARAFCE